jgi:hypothetical protein
MKKETTALRGIEHLIHDIRGQKVILDADLARIYGVETRTLNQAVQRNRKRFPVDFVFRVTAREAARTRTHEAAIASQTADDETDAPNRSQIVIGSSKHRDPSYRPLAFTEHGALMAANVLRSPRAVEMSVFIVRAFVRIRGALVSQYETAKSLEQIEKVLLVHDRQLQELFEQIRPLLLPPPEPPAKRIGFGVAERRARYGRSKALSNAKRAED